MNSYRPIKWCRCWWPWEILKVIFICSAQCNGRAIC